MNIHRFEGLVEKHTGAILCKSSNYKSGSHVLFPASRTYFPELTDYDEIDAFWSQFFAREAYFDKDGNLTDESRKNILSHLEAIQVSARAISLELLHGMNIIAAHVPENEYTDR